MTCNVIAPEHRCVFSQKNIVKSGLSLVQQNSAVVGVLAARI